MKFEKSFFKPKQTLTAAALNRIENTLATLTETLYQDGEVILSELLPGLFDDTDCIITSEDMAAVLDGDAEGKAYELIQAGFVLGVNKNHEGIQSDTFDAIIGCKYDGVKYFCKPVVFAPDEDNFILYMGNLKVLYDLAVLQGDSEGAEMLQSSVSKAGFTLDVFENLPVILAMDNSTISLMNVENDSVTESFGSHTFEIISSIPPESRGVVQESLVIDKLPNVSEEVFVRGLNIKTGLKLILNSGLPITINGKLFNMNYSDAFAQQLPDGSSPSLVYYATALDLSSYHSNILYSVTHYFTDLPDSSGFDVSGKLVYRGSRTQSYDLSSLKQ